MRNTIRFYALIERFVNSIFFDVRHLLDHENIFTHAGSRMFFLEFKRNPMP
jgi:hypothetical protein